MQTLHTNRNTKRSVYAIDEIISKFLLVGNRLYFLKIGNSNNRLFKIGTTNDILRRMKEHTDKYKEDVTILWVSPIYSKYTTLRIEDRVKQTFIDLGFDWIKNDRFIIPTTVKDITIKVRKNFIVNIDV